MGWSQQGIESVKRIRTTERRMKETIKDKMRYSALRLGLLGATCLMTSLSAVADIVIVESRSGGKNNEYYGEMAGVGGTWANSSAKATVSPCTVGIGCRYGYTNASFPQLEGELKGPGFFASPLLAIPGPAGVYRIDVTLAAAATSASGDIEVSVWFTNCTGTVVSGKAGSPANTTTNFQYASASATPLNVWRTVGYLTNNVGMSQPTVCFQYYSGTVTSSKRFFADAVLFTYMGDLCPQVAAPAVNGPLAAGQTSVFVQNILPGATNINIYKVTGTPATYERIGGIASPVAGTVNSVGVSSALNKDDLIIATQTRNGIESCKETPTPARVGGGANPAGGLRVAFNIRENVNAGPIVGSDGGTGGDVFFLGSASRVGGAFGAAPDEGQIITPSQDWQSVTFTRGVDPASTVDKVYCWSTTGQEALDGNYGVLDSIAFAINDLTDTGPYAVYIGKVINGGKVIQDFSGATNGQPTVMFSLPGELGTAAQTGNLLAQAPGAYSPNVSVVVNTNGGTSGKSALISWQWNNTLPATWVQLLTRGTGTPNPVVDLRQPITVEMLLLPVGTANGRAALDVTPITNNAVWTTSDVTMRVSTPEAGATYQWYQGNTATATAIDGATSSSYTINGMYSGNNGVYTVAVTAGGRVNTRSAYLYALDPIPTITNQPVNAIVAPGFTGTALSVGADPHVAAGAPLWYQWRKDGLDIVGQSASTLAFAGGAQVSDAGLYDVVVGNGYGSVTSSVASVYVLSQAAGTGTGLQGSYWTARTNTFTATPTLTRLDSQVNFEWGTDRPATGVAADYFTARWAGQVQALGTDSYTFYTVTDDGVRLWVNGTLLIDNWTPHGAITNSGTIALTGANKYDVVLEFFENTGAATMKLWWDKLGGGLPQSAIPASQLYPAAAAVPAITLDTPANGASYTEPGTIDMAASVTPLNYLATGVEFYTNGVLFASDTAAPYAATLAGVPAGTYKIQARLLFNGGAVVGDVVGSATNSVTVTPATPPSVSISTSGGNINVAGTGPTGVNFVLYRTPALAPLPTSWTPVQTNTAGTGSFSFTIVPGQDPKGFFRVGTQ